MDHAERVVGTCGRHVASVLGCGACGLVWAPCCGGASPHPPDLARVARLRAEIARDPAGFVASRLPAAADRLLRDLG